MLNKEINKALAKENFSAEEMEEILSKLASKTESAEQMAAFLIALRAKGETVEELTGAARFLRRKGQFIDTGAAEVMDIVGTVLFLVPAVGLFSAGAYTLDEHNVNVSLTKQSGN